MKKKFSLSIFLVLFFCLQSTTAQTVTQTLIPVDDSYIYSDNTIRGMETLLKTYHSTAGNQYRRISFLKFDISGLSPFVDTLKLRLYTNGFTADGDNAHQFDLYPVALNSWSEDDITFLNYKEKAGEDITSPLLASYIVPAGEALAAQYIEFSGANLQKYVSDSLSAGKQYISFRLREKYVVKQGANAVIVEFHSKENTSGFVPQLVVEEKDIETLKAVDIKVGGVSINNFSENKYRYVYHLAWNETNIPVVSAMAKYPTETTVAVTQAVSLNGNEENRTAKVQLQKGSDVLTYSVVFELLPPPNDARLSGITIDGKNLEFFETGKEAYLVHLPYTALTVPQVTAQNYDPNASVNVVDAVTISPAASEQERTTVLNVTSADETQTKTYRVVFSRLPELDLILAIGQSNMAGRAPYDAYQEEMENVYLLTPAGEMEISSNPMNKYSNIRKDISLQKLGPSYACALDLQRHLSKPVGFIVNAQGGSSITTWYEAGKSNYDATITRAKEAQRFGRIRAIIWHQGESDSSNSGTYINRLSTMVQSLRTDLNEPDLFFAAGELAYWRGGGTGSTAFNTMIRTIVGHIPNSDWISAEGCSQLIDNNDPHFGTEGAILLGERYAEKIIQHVYNDAASVNDIDNNAFPKLITYANGLKIINNDTQSRYKVLDLSGRTVQKGVLQAYQSTDISINKGVYLVSLTQENINQTFKLLIY